MKFNDPKASAALYAQLVAADTAPAEQADDLDNQADELLLVSDWKTAEALARRALDSHMQAADQRGEGKSTRIIARALCGQGKDQEAIRLCEDALVCDRAVRAAVEEAKVLRAEGIAYEDLSRYSRALDCFNQSLSDFRSAGDLESEADVILSIGIVYDYISEMTKAVGFLKMALPIYERFGNPLGEAHVLGSIGSTYGNMGQNSKAIAYYLQALPIYRRIGNGDAEADDLINISTSYLYLSQYTNVIRFADQAVPIYQNVGDKDGAAFALMTIGDAYNDLAHHSQALDYYNRSLPIFQSVGDQDNEANALSNIGTTNTLLGQYSKAIIYQTHALLIFRRIGDRKNEAIELDEISQTYEHINQDAKAVDCVNQALPLSRRIGDKDGEAYGLTVIGSAYGHLGQYTKAVNCLNQALLVLRSIRNRDGEAEALQDLMQGFSNKKNPSHNLRLAVYYGKRFVNTVQSIRRSNASLAKTTLTSYVESKSAGYRELADLLIQQGRLPEAQQVLRLLKDREFYDFLHSQGDEDDHITPAEPISLTPRERRWSDAYDAAAAHVEDLQNQSDALNRSTAPTITNKAKMASLKSQVNTADAGVVAVLTKTAKSFGELISRQDRLPNTAVAGDVAAALKPGEAALYTIVSPDRLDLILIVPPKHGQATKPKVYARPIKQADLYTQVYRLRTALTDPQVDPRPLAASLYDLVLRPVKRDLVAAHVKTILFSLDDALRYIPPAALYDNETKRYVVQDYATALITLAGNAPTSQKTALTPEIIGAGVSQSPGSADPPLPGVKQELDGIVHQTGDAKTSGLYPGTRMLDQQFTRAALEGCLAKHTYPMVHLASHFLLHATDADSYLLLGDGTQMSVQDIRQDPKRFADVDLLTLSACDTAMEVKSSTGREVEGLGALAQSLGAKTVLASLWPVSDTETPKLMIAFYAYHKAHPTAALPEALRQAQLSLLARRGARPGAEDGARGTKMVGAADRTLPVFQADASRADAHPYYWAPFVLLGNWR